MAQESTRDKLGNEIYLTDERWAHIVETHEEMIFYRNHIFVTLRTGQRRQDAFDPSKYKYTKRFTDLTEGFTHIVVVVKLTQREDAQGTERSNNFVLTAYQVSRRSV
ncbi:MAG: hypothetical protein HY268_24555 [Deltaproteobacteria bacterium]|nr:hypothetical protein [Deltaproteobacteria bacterium]